MRVPKFVALALLLFCVVEVCSQTNESFARVTICELADHPEKFVGQTVVVRGWVARGKHLTLLDSEIPSGCRNDILALLLPEEVKPRPDFRIEKNEAFDRFQAALKERTHVEGSFQGRFDFTKGRKTAMRLILERVSELVVTPTGHVDR
jgi:hypothetical protein